MQPLPQDETKNSTTNTTQIRFDKTNLFDNTYLIEKECELLTSQIYILSDKKLHEAVTYKILKLYPKLTKLFSLISESDRQASFILKMVKKGYLDVGYKRSSNILKQTMVRHINHGVSEKCIHDTLNVILETVLNLLQDGLYWNKDNGASSKSAWIKANDILNDITHKAYSTSRKDMKKKKKRKQIQRVMSNDDINCVHKTWNELIIEHKDKVSGLLATKIENENDIYAVFWQNDADVVTQSVKIIDMIDKAITLLSNNDHDELISYLTKISIIHGKMNIKPYLMVLMQNIILALIKDILSYNYTKNIRESYKKVFTFIVGILLNKLTLSAREASVDSFETFEAYDIEQLQLRLTQSVINNCQLSWKYIQNNMDFAVTIFYNGLDKAQVKIKQLFSKLNMRKQAKRIFKAIGATVYLLDDMETLGPILHALGKRHIYYGVRPEHFKIMKQWWFDMLVKVLSKTWSGQLLQTMTSAWNVAWSIIVHYMKTSLEDALLSYICSEPTLVKFKVIIHHIDQINVNNSSFYGDIWYSVHTGANKLQPYLFNNNDKSIVETMPQYLNINCLNVMETINNKTDTYVRYFDEDDSWYLKSNITGIYSNTFDVKRYPFDVHNIEITFSLEVDDTNAIFDEKHLSVRSMRFKLDSMGGNDYNVYEPFMNLVELSAIKGGSISGKRYTHCRITIPISHNYTYCIYNVILPLIGIELIQFCVYFVELTPISSPLIIILVLFLTIFGLQKSINHWLPPRMYYTFLDYVFNCAYLLSIYHLIAIYIIYKLEYMSNDKCIVINNSIIGVGLFIFLIINFVLYLRAKHFISLYPKQNQCDGEGKKALDFVATHASLRKHATLTLSPINSNAS